MSVGPYNPLMVEEGDTAAMLCEVSTAEITGELHGCNPQSLTTLFLVKRKKEFQNPEITSYKKWM